jgi:predicted metal-dependent phosphoesterase TrpH
MLTIETHCHTGASPDSLMTPEDLLAACRELGIDRVIVTDHWSIEGALAAKELDPERVIVGEELLTDRGELLAAFVTEVVPRRTPYREAIQLLRDQGAFISVSHPCDPKRGIWTKAELEELAGLVDAFETFNGRVIFQQFNKMAAQFASRFGLPGTAGSDAHTAAEVGRAVMRLPDFTDADGLRKVIGQAEVRAKASSPWVRVASRWAKLIHKRSQA